MGGPDLTGAHGLSVARKRFEMVHTRQEERLADVKRALENISHMQTQMQMPLKFEVAAEDELCTPNMADGVILLPATAHNARFQAFVSAGHFDRACRTEM